MKYTNTFFEVILVFNPLSDSLFNISFLSHVFSFPAHIPVGDRTNTSASAGQRQRTSHAVCLFFHLFDCISLSHKCNSCHAFSVFSKCWIVFACFFLSSMGIAFVVSFFLFLFYYFFFGRYRGTWDALVKTVKGSHTLGLKVNKKHKVGFSTLQIDFNFNFN